MSTWLSGVGECELTWRRYPNKAQRDYAASQANKTPGYIKHSLGELNTPKDQFTLAIYWKKV